MLTELYTSWSLVFLYLPTVFAGIFLLTYILVSTQFLLTLLTSIFYLYRKPNMEKCTNSGLPGVSIVKPLMGVDSCLEENLESHFRLRYGGPFELLFCVEDATDSSIDVVERLCKRYPHVDCRIFKAPTRQIMNPMVRNMVQGYDGAKYDIIWICTSRVKVNDYIMNDLIHKLTSGSGSRVELVHQMPYFLEDAPCCVPQEQQSPSRHVKSPNQHESPLHSSFIAELAPPESPSVPKQNEESSHSTTKRRSGTIESALEKIYFGTAVPRSYFFLWAIGQRCFTGMSYVFRKSSLDRTGGLGHYGRYLAEDFYICQALCKYGRQTISSYPALQNVGNTSLVTLKDRLVRWMRLRISTVPSISLYLEPMQECIPCGLAASWAIVVHFQMMPYFSFVTFFLLHMLVWFTLEALIFHTLARCRTSLGFSFGYVFAWVLRQLLCLYVYFEAYLNPFTIRWGPRVYRMNFWTGEATLVSRDRPKTPDQI